MPEINDLSTWHKLSSQLLCANPTTTRITTRYTVFTCSPSDNPRKRKATEASTAEAEGPTKKAKVIVRTFDTKSATALWFVTSKQQEMSQVLRYLGDLGGGMAGKEKKDMIKEEVDEGGELGGVASGGVATPVQAVIEEVKKIGGGKKKKKGKGK